GQNWIDATAGLPQHDPDSPEEIQKDIDYARGLPSADDAEPFFVHYANVEADTTGHSLPTPTDGRIWVASLNAAGTTPTWTAISQDLSGRTPARGCRNVVAWRTNRTLYGAVGDVSAQPFYYSLTGNTPSTWVVAQPVRPTGTADRLIGPSSMDFPPGAAN